MCNSDNAKTLAAFREATRELDSIYALFPKSCELSEPEYWSLLLIYEGFVTQSQISEQLYFSRQTLNSAFKQLRKKGLVKLQPYEDNQRSKQAFLTESGKEFVKKNVLQMHKIEEKAWRGMSKEEHAALIELTQKFTKLILNQLNTSKSDN
mgnify:CR=1 FL=1